jgi:hypothetical protein
MKLFPTFLVFGSLWAALGFGGPLDHCGDEAAKGVATALVRAATHDPSGSAADARFRPSTNLTLVDHGFQRLTGPLFTFQAGTARVLVAARDCSPIQYTDQSRAPATWPRPISKGGGTDLEVLAELKKNHVTVTRQEALLSATTVARAMVGSDLFEKMTLVHGDLTDQGRFFAYTFHWLRELVESNVRLGIWTLRVYVNPANGRVYDAHFFRIDPQTADLIAPGSAVKIAQGMLATEKCPQGWKLKRVGAGQHFLQSGEVVRFWAVVFQCNVEGRHPPLVSIKINGISGKPLEER